MPNLYRVIAEDTIHLILENQINITHKVPPDEERILLLALFHIRGIGYLVVHTVTVCSVCHYPYVLISLLETKYTVGLTYLQECKRQPSIPQMRFRAKLKIVLSMSYPCVPI